jgi:diguanylate cyclase (GGDEF)-like protein
MPLGTSKESGAVSSSFVPAVDPPRDAGAKVIALRGPVRLAGLADSEPRDAGADGSDFDLAVIRKAQRRRRTLLQGQAYTAGAYLLDGALLGLFALSGTVGWGAAAMHAGLGLLATAVMALLFATGAAERFKDPRLTLPQAAVAMALCVLGLALFPRVGFVYALMLFLIFLTSTYRLPVRHAVVAWIVVCVAAGAVTLALPDGSFQIPDRTPIEQAIAWLCFAAALGRCVFVSLYSNLNNVLLAQKTKQLAATLAQVERMANHDELTGVLNRRSLLRMLGEELARADRHGSPVSVAILDLDKFKLINDALGHLAGDKVLKMFSTLVDTLARNTDRFGRYGGEEFLLILIDTSAEDAQHAIDRIRAALPSVNWSSVEPGLSPSFSAGVACYSKGETAEQLLSRADEALYVAKDEGRGCTRVA